MDVSGQDVPHAPQLQGSERGSVQALPQKSMGAAHEQPPLAQLAGAVHWMPHPPQ